MARLKGREFEALSEPLQIELVRMQSWVKESGAKLLVIVEGRDAAGKGGAIRRLVEPLNPRGCRVVALEKPGDRERTQWYFQRYVAHLPAGGEIAVFDRSWYNRAGLERVMGFCTAAEVDGFLRDVPEFERLLVRSGILLRKIWLEISREEQARRLAKRRDDPVKKWRTTPLDLAAQDRWDDYTRAEQDLFRRTSTVEAPWTVVQADDKRRARLNLIRWLLSTLDYPARQDKLLRLDRDVIRTVGAKS
jgi:polyphosphate kinase 2